MRLLLGIVLAMPMLLMGASRPLAAEGLVCAGVRLPALSPPNRSGAAKLAAGSAAGTRRALALFARFRGENAGQTSLPGWAAGIFDPELPGSFTHFYATMSFGKLQVSGAVGPRWYESAQPASFYLAEGEAGSLGRFGQFSREILRQADAEIDFSRFDSDGPDGVANSGDDDGVVDALFLVMASTPAGFILADAAATGIAGLGFEGEFATDDAGAAGRPIQISPDQGTLQQGHSLAEAVGAMAHEYGHLLGLPDLYNTEFLSSDGVGPEQDGAGIGKWGLMGWGALGWNGDRPASLSAWSRLQLGWAQVVEPAGEEAEMQLEEVGRRGMLYQIPLNQREFFLIEYRRRTSSYYDRDIPAEGLLIWHVERTLLSQESLSRVDLECADGRWRDAGFPLGVAPAPEEGEDNLDFWAHDAEYAQAHGGNLGDATDVFDGQRFTAFTPTSNPSSYSSDRRRSVRIEQIRLEEGMARAAIRRDPARIEIAVLELPASGEVVAGQPVQVGFALRNSGGTNATGLTARLRTADPLVEVLDPEVALNDLGMDGEHHGSAVVQQGFPRVRFASAFDGTHTAALNLEIYGHGQRLAGQEFALTARLPYRLSGRIVSEAGEPLAGTTVVARGAGDYRTSAVTDAEGRYELSVLPGQYDLFIRPARGQRAASQRRTGLSIFADQQLDFTLPTLLEIAGTITAADGAPLRGVFVVGNPRIDGNLAESFYVQTNDDGFYRLLLQRGTYLLRAVPGAGMREAFAPQEIGEVVLDQDRAIDVQLQRGVQVTVRVTDERGQEVNGITVQLRGAEREIYPEVLTRTQGMGTVNVLPGVRLVAVTEPLPGPYVLPDSFLVEVVRDTTVRVVLAAGSWIAGELRDAAGGRVEAQGQVVFRSLAGDGQFAVQVEEGRYGIGLARDGYRVQWQRFNGAFPSQDLGQVEVAGDAVVDLALVKGLAIQGRVTDDRGQPLAGGTLRFRSLDNGLAVTAGVTASGGYAATLLAGEYQVAIHFLGSPLPDQELGVVGVRADGDFDFAVQQGIPVVGRVVDGVGEGLPGVSVTAYALDASARGAVRSGISGGFSLPLPPHRYRLALTAASGARSTTWIVEEVEVPTAGPLELRPPGGARLAGRVVDGRGRLVQATVLLTRDPRALYDRAHAGYVAAVSTGRDGFYQFEAPPGEYALVAYPGGQFQLGSVQRIQLAGDRVVDLELPAPVDLPQLDGRLLDEQGTGVGAALLQFYSESEGKSGQVQTEGDGYYRIELPPGRYQVAAALAAGVGYGQVFALGEVEVDGARSRDLVLRPQETAVEAATGAGPEGFSLQPNYPNPFNAATVIAYHLARPTPVKLTVYNLAGQSVATLTEGERPAGAHGVRWDGRDDRGKPLASGVYLYRLEAGNQLATRKLLLLK